MSDVHVIFVLGMAAIHLVGVASGLRALFTARSPQGSIAWIMAMITFPYLTVPLYWVLGRNRFHGYLKAKQVWGSEFQELSRKLVDYRALTEGAKAGASGLRSLEKLARTPFTTHNDSGLLVNGQETFDAIFAAMDKAEKYLLVQFFIIHDDELGRELKKRLVAKASQGVNVYLLYDEIGSHKLPKPYLEELSLAGVVVRPFDTTKGLVNRLQINFRNHRKIVVVDGKTAFVGGHNVGDEYMGREKRFGPWRDTHAWYQGPVVAMIQLSFLEDWYWSTRETLPLDWEMRPADNGNMTFLTLPSGPADKLQTCSLFFTQAINMAKERLWIVSPYFVPAEDVTSALQLAVMRGVDVRIMLPLKPDHLLVYLASFAYIGELEKLGVKFFRYKPGFLHQKVMLVDDSMACVGTANFDNRSFHLNFEITMVGLDDRFIGDVEKMLLNDFRSCVPATAKDYERRWIGFKVGVKIARLFSPIL